MFRKTANAIIRPVRSALRRGSLFAPSAESLSKKGITVKVTMGKPSADWARTRRATLLTVQQKPFISRKSRIFAIGSCFAMEIRAALRNQGFQVFPDYFQIEYDAANQSIAGLPAQDDINHYDTFTILREYEIAFNGLASSPDDFWEVTSPGIKLSVDLKGKSLFQNPLRKRVFSTSREGLADLSSKLDARIAHSIREADIHIITLGLIETWRNKRTGSYLCMAPGRDQMQDAEFHLSDFQANLDNMRRVCSLVKTHAPAKMILLTVSPVPLARTYAGKDIIVANMESKSLLRAVAGQIEREFDNVIYWPSYEIAAYEDIYEEDGRHVTRAAVNKIVDSFMEAHCQK